MTRYRVQVWVCAAFLASLAVGSKAMAASPKGGGANHAALPADPGEARMIAEMASNDPHKVLKALADLEEKQNPGTNAIGAARKLLSDPRPAVRKKAARVLGAIHAPLDQDEIKTICRMLKSYDPSEADDALKALRDLKVSEAIAEITPLLKSAH